MTVVEMKEKFNEMFDQLIKEGKGDYTAVVYNYDNCDVEEAIKESLNSKKELYSKIIEGIRLFQMKQWNLTMK